VLPLVPEDMEDAEKEHPPHTNTQTCTQVLEAIKFLSLLTPEVLSLVPEDMEDAEKEHSPHKNTYICTQVYACLLQGNVQMMEAVRASVPEAVLMLESILPKL